MPSRRSFRLALLVLVCVSACRRPGDPGQPTDLAGGAFDGGLALYDGGDGGGDRAGGDLGPVTLRGCPTSGKGAIHAPAGCFVLTPAEAGADPAGANAGADQYALEPAAPAAGTLVVFLNGSYGAPANQIPDPTQNFYDAAAVSGYHLLAVAYRSGDEVGVLCVGAPECFSPTRRTVLFGTVVDGTAKALTNMRADEGIMPRLTAALRRLAAARPGAGWDQFLTSDGDVAWDKVITAGHSQGGGHAAYLGLLYPVRRVIQLSSTCDYTSGVPAPWTAAAGPWQTTPSSAFVGFAAPTTFNGAIPSGDLTCPYHAAVWQNMGLDASRMHDDAATCNLVANTHSASIACSANYPRWLTLFKDSPPM